MGALFKNAMFVAAIVLLPASAWAQATLAGAVTDTSGGLLPGVTVEAASPALIERVRTAVTDGSGRYRIEDLRPGMYTVSFTLPGFATVIRERLEVGGSGVIAVNAELRVGGVEETITVVGGTPVVDVHSTRREIALDNETMRNLPGVRSYSYLLTSVPGLQTNISNVNTGPVFAIFPIYGGRGVESRLTVDGLNISNPPGGNQPPNFVADIGNAEEVTMLMSGGLGESETAGLTMNIVPRQGGNSLSGLMFASGFSEGMQATNYTDELQARGVTQPTPVYRVYDVNTAVGGPIVRDRLWYYTSLRWQGQRQNTLNVYYNQNAGNPNAWTYVADLSRPAFSDRTWENYTPRITWQMTGRHKFSFSWDEQPVCRTCTGTTSLTGTPNFIFPTSPEADGTGEFSPQRIQQVRWTSPATNRLLLEAGFGSTYYQWGGRERPDNPRDLVQVVNIGQLIVPATDTTPAVTSNMRYRSHNWLNNRTAGANYVATASYVTGSHSLKFGFQGHWWRDDRELHTNTQRLGYTFVFGTPVSITQYAAPYNVNARAMQASLFVQDQWTVGRLTLQGALRYDRPWSWFPEQNQPASRFFPGATFPRTEGVTAYHDLTPRMGAAYDVFGTGRTALKVNLGKYLQGASVSNLAYGSNPALRIPGGGGGIFPPSVSRSWTDANSNFVPDCDLADPLANGECGQINNLLFGSNQLIGAQFDPGLFSGWGVRPSDWSFGVSVQQELVPRASVEVAYNRRSFTMYTTGGTVTDNLAVSPNDLATYTVTAPSDPRLPGGGGYTVGPLYNLNPAVFGQSDLLIKSTKDVGDDTRVYNGVSVTLSVRSVQGFTFSGGTNTGKVTDDWCAIRAAVPESYLLNPYCRIESPFQTSYRGLVTYTIPRIDTLVSTVYADRPATGVNQIASLPANYTLTAADRTAAEAQMGRTFTTTGVDTVNLIQPGQLYGDRVRTWDFSAKKIVRFGGQRFTVGADIYNMLNNNVTLAYNGVYSPATTGWLQPTSYMNPRVFRLNAEFAW
jgi:hypothetical protein